uniref:Transmembrane protein n=1 Tax=Kalanchoe fedtschenkoi TaxID=63787 RepID=A0A7N0RC57_KALFE
MGIWHFILSSITWQTFGPFLHSSFDDIRASNQLVQKLLIPDHTKQFVYAFREPETGAVIYILLRPDAVVAQLVNYEVPEIQAESKDNVEGVVPTTAMEVVKRCFIDKLNKEKYESTAGTLVLKVIFGVGFHGHFLAAKDAAKEIGSAFLVLESPFAFVNSLVSQKVGSVALKTSQRFCNLNEIQMRVLRSMSTYMDATLLQRSPGMPESIQPKSSYVPPPFAQPIYPLLSDLHAMFSHLPSIGRALAQVQKVFDDVNVGESVDTKVLYDVFMFRIAVEVLRMALNSAGRVPINKIGSSSKHNAVFSELSVDEKSDAVLAQALRYQSGKHKSIVAVIDATCLEGLRRYWNTSVPREVKDLVGELVTSCEDYGDPSNQSEKKRLLTSNPQRLAVGVGVGATAVVGASSLSKIVPASTFIKILTFKLPAASLKLVAAESHRAFALALSKVLGPFKLVAPGLAGSGTKSASTMKAIVSAKKIRAITHSAIASAEKTSFSAMRAAFYQIMRNRAIRPIGVLPWATFGCSVATCAGLVMYGDGLECAAESLPAASSIANLGRGIQSLRQAAEQTEQSSLQKSLEAMMYRLKKAKFSVG